MKPDAARVQPVTDPRPDPADRVEAIACGLRPFL
jgi:hypothetical protein